MQINLATSQDQKWTLFLGNRAPNRDFEFALANCVQIAEGGGPGCGGSCLSLIWKGIEYMALKVNILKIDRTQIRVFPAFAGILSTMDADQLGDFTEPKMSIIPRELSSGSRF